MTDALHHLTIAEASSLIERQELSPVALTEAFLGRIESVNPNIAAGWQPWDDVGVTLLRSCCALSPNDASGRR